MKPIRPVSSISIFVSQWGITTFLYSHPSGVIWSQIVISWPMLDRWSLWSEWMNICSIGCVNKLANILYAVFNPQSCAWISWTCLLKGMLGIWGEAIKNANNCSVKYSKQWKHAADNVLHLCSFYIKITVVPTSFDYYSCTTK